MSGPLQFINLPNEVLEKVFSFLPYDEIAKNRVVCRKFNTTCGQLLNRGFLLMERRHSTILKKVKSLLPRRESERRVHQLARHCDILTAIETRISMLGMTFMKYIDVGACYFIPGKVIDEILRILSLVENTNTPPRTHEVLQELRDISSMAMEHFDEKIAPNLKLKRATHVPTFAIPGSSTFNPSLPRIVVHETFRKEFSSVQHRTRRHSHLINLLKNLVSKLTSKVKLQNHVISSQSARIREQTAKINEQVSSIAEMKRHVEEWDLKFADLSAELSRARDDTSQNTVSTSSTKPSSSPSLYRTTSSYSPPRLFKSNIKPRMAQILPRSVSIDQYLDGDRKRKSTMPNSALVPVPSKISRIQLLRNKNEEDSTKDDNRGIISCRSDNMFPRLPLFLSSSLEMLLKSPISSLKSRKHKLQ